MNRRSELEPDPHHFYVLEAHKMMQFRFQLQLRPPYPSLLKQNVQKLYFALCNPKDRGRIQSRSRSRIIFPCWSRINMMWF
jgi:hypothetical protein